MYDENAEYYRNRAIEERERAAKADLPEIVKIRLELAEKYEALAELAKGHPNHQTY
jgi:hypothetical protein